jgi:hypothetical protein
MLRDGAELRKMVNPTWYQMKLDPKKVFAFSLAISGAISGGFSNYYTATMLSTIADMGDWWGIRPEIWLALGVGLSSGLMLFWLARKRPHWFMLGLPARFQKPEDPGKRQ